MALQQLTLPSAVSKLKNSLLYACVYIPQKVFKCSEAVSFHGADGLQAWGERTKGPHWFSSQDVFSVLENVHHAQNRIIKLCVAADDNIKGTE